MRRNSRKRMYITLGLLILLLTIAYAFLTSNLSVSGTSNIDDIRWDIHFENAQSTSNSTVTPTVPPSAPAASKLTTISYDVTFNEPGDIYEFTIDTVNGGTVDAMIESYTSKIKVGNGEEVVIASNKSNLPSYLDYDVTYSDGGQILANHQLLRGASETIKVRITFKSGLTIAQIEEAANKVISFNISIDYKQTDGTEVAPTHAPESFATDSWETIINAVKTGNTSTYSVGDTKTIELGNGLGTHTVRIANKSTPSECSTSGFSQTACGFVIEFADIITESHMNPDGTYKEIEYVNGWSVDGWPATEMRAYLNGTKFLEGTELETDYTGIGIYDALPKALKNGIINTTVVTGRCHGESSNHTSTDKLYLLSTHEVFVDDDGDTSTGIDHRDTAYNKTRQLDYYAGLNVTSTNYSNAIKQYNGVDHYWWLRTPRRTNDYHFYRVKAVGEPESANAHDMRGISPAFRIG